MRYCFILQSLRVSLLNDEDANAVETDREQGYGPIHYIVIMTGNDETENDELKRELLLVLFVHGNAELDLTTTQHGMTALRLAVEVRYSGLHRARCLRFTRYPHTILSLQMADTLI